MGPSNAILIDTPLSPLNATAVSTWLTQQLSPKNITLQYIYLTHGHGDHFFGIPTILSHFPNTTVIATPGTVAHVAEQLTPASLDGFWKPFFPDLIVPQTEIFVPLPDDGLFTLDGFELRAIEVGQTDTFSSTVLHVPSLSMVVAGDAVYGSCFQYLQETSTAELRAEWLRALLLIEQLEPEIVIPSHRQEFDDFSIHNIDRTREYLRSWEVEVLDTAALSITDPGEQRTELFRRMSAVFPERVGDFIFELSALAAFPGNGSGNSTF
ncbi:hypothetical protein EG329_005448 [Mollisiaceae sp. DMI_Dod_QoI]|nr:hypothetical protein EG329_005448 [Helotiales sp. DMI_Dod_QoI]